MIVQFYLRLIRPLLSRIIFSRIASGFSEQQKEAAQKTLDTIMSSLATISDVAEQNKKFEQDGYKWRSDPGNGVLDFSPEDLWLFIARKGDDCDGWAEFNYRACKNINLEPKMWVIIDHMKFDTSHVVTTCKNPATNKYYLFNNSDVTTFDTEDECIDIFSKEALMASGVYENLKKYLYKK